MKQIFAIMVACVIMVGIQLPRIAYAEASPVTITKAGSSFNKSEKIDLGVWYFEDNLGTYLNSIHLWGLYYTFDAPEAGTYTFTTEGVTGSIGVRVYDQYEQLLTSCGSSDERQQVSCKLNAGQKCIVLLTSWPSRVKSFFGICSPSKHIDVGAWVTEEAATATTSGKRVQYCTFCNQIANTEVIPPTIGTPAIKNGKLGIYNGNNLSDYTGFAKFEGADFYFEHGIIRDDMDGLTLINGTWYNMQQGRFNTADGMVFFEGATFLVKGGVIDETQSGLIEYDGQRFVFSYGQFVSSLYGAWPDPISGRFVYIWAGQFYPITDLVSYDGQIFYFIDGYLATDFVGTVYDFNGTPFNVIYGQVY